MSNLNDYEGKHRDNSPEAITRGLEIDHDYAWSPIYPCKRYHGTVQGARPQGRGGMTIPGAIAVTAIVFLFLAGTLAMAGGEAEYRNRRPLLTLAAVSLGLAAVGFIAAAWMEAL